MFFFKAATALLGASSFVAAWSAPLSGSEAGLLQARDAMLDSIDTYYAALAARDLVFDEMPSLVRRMDPEFRAHLEKTRQENERRLQEIQAQREAQRHNANSISKGRQPVFHERDIQDEDDLFSFARM